MPFAASPHGPASPGIRKSLRPGILMASSSSMYLAIYFSPSPFFCADFRSIPLKIVDANHVGVRDVSAHADQSTPRIARIEVPAPKWSKDSVLPWGARLDVSGCGIRSEEHTSELQSR